MTITDRAAAVRTALRRLVAERGFHGASMSAVAREAGVATGTAYVHYESKEELVYAAYLEAKRELGEAAVAVVDPTAPPDVRFRQLWRGAHAHLAARPDRARFLLQVDQSPYGARAHELAMAEEGDRLAEAAAAPDTIDLLAPLPMTVLYELGLGPAVRLAASGEPLDDGELDLIAEGCWKAITR